MTISSDEKSGFHSIFDVDHPDSVRNRMPTDINKAALDNLPQYLRSWSAAALERKMGERLTHKDRILKIAFWREYYDAIDNGRLMSIAGMTKGVCSRDYWSRVVVKHSALLAWILQPDPSYSSTMEEMLSLSVRRLRDIVALRAVKYDRRGQVEKIDHSLMKIQLSAHSLIENRVRGLAPQKLQIEQKSMNVNVNAKAPEKLGEVRHMSVNELDREIMNLRMRMESSGADMSDLKRLENSYKDGRSSSEVIDAEVSE